MTLQAQLGAAKTLLQGQLADVNSLSLLIDQYTTFLREDMPGRSYNQFSDAMKCWLADLSSRFSTNTVNKIHQFELVTLMQSSLEKMEKN